MTRAAPYRALALILVLAGAAAAAPAAAEPGDAVLRAPQPYFGARLALARPLAGDGDTAWAFDHGHGAGIAGGAHFGEFAGEIELAFASLDAADREGLAERERVEGQEHLASLSVNGRWEPAVGALFYGIVGAGAGMTHVEWDQVRRGSAALAADDDVASYALEAGLGSRFWGAMAFEVTWRRVGLGPFEYREADGSRVRMDDTRHDLLCMGLRYDL